jgi:uncharacterized protein (DUF1800 family)
MRYFCSLLLLGMAASALAAEPAPDRAEIVHVLNRLGYGPRPGDVECVAKIGVHEYIEQQLHPENIEDTACSALLKGLETLDFTGPQLAQAYYADIRNFIAQQKAAGGMSEDMKLRYGINLGKNEAAPDVAPATPAPAPKTAAEKMEEAAKHVSVRALGELQTSKVVRAVMSERQLQEVLVDFWSNHFNIDARKNECRSLKTLDDRETIRPHVLGKFRDLLGASAHSAAMLAYLDNKDNSKPRELSVAEQKIRAAVVEKLVGFAAMQAEDKPKMDGGLNENYGREILELHTLGVDGGYTQKDVQEVARCFTGWGIQPLKGEFGFDPRRHDDGEKVVLGVTIPAGGGESDGEQVLDMIARHPATAHHIAYQLCQRFIADEPPKSAVDRAAAVFTQTQGDLREVVKSIVESEEFSAPEARRTKVKSPFEFAVSSVRILGATASLEEPGGFQKVRWTLEGAAMIGFGADHTNGLPRKSLNWRIHDLGQPLFGYTAPTGWPEDSRKWVSAGALIARLNFALDLVSGKVVGVNIPPSPPPVAEPENPDAVIDAIADRFELKGLSEGTRHTLREQLVSTDDGTMASTGKKTQLLALVLGCPEFQRK